MLGDRKKLQIVLSIVQRVFVPVMNVKPSRYLGVTQDKVVHPYSRMPQCGVATTDVPPKGYNLVVVLCINESKLPFGKWYLTTSIGTGNRVSCHSIFSPF